MPWDLLSLDFTRDNLEYVATSNGLATGNTRDEALVSGVAELLEHHFVAMFERLSARARRRPRRCALATIDDPGLRAPARSWSSARVSKRRAWSLAGDHAVPVFRGSDCSNATAFVRRYGAGRGQRLPSPRRASPSPRALLEAVQTRAGLVAGGRDDLTAARITDRCANATSPSCWDRWPSTTGLLDVARGSDDGLRHHRGVPRSPARASRRDHAAAGRRFRAFRHPARRLACRACPRAGIARCRARPRQTVGARGAAASSASPRCAREPCPSAGRILFAGPSIAGLAIPPGIEVRPPAKCGDLATLARPPAGGGGAGRRLFQTGADSMAQGNPRPAGASACGSSAGPVSARCARSSSNGSAWKAWARSSPPAAAASLTRDDAVMLDPRAGRAAATHRCRCRWSMPSTSLAALPAPRTGAAHDAADRPDRAVRNARLAFVPDTVPRPNRHGLPHFAGGRSKPHRRSSGSMPPCLLASARRRTGRNGSRGLHDAAAYESSSSNPTDQIGASVCRKPDLIHSRRAAGEIGSV